MINGGVTRRAAEVLVCFHHSQVRCGSWLNPCEWTKYGDAEPIIKCDRPGWKYLINVWRFIATKPAEQLGLPSES